MNKIAIFLCFLSVFGCSEDRVTLQLSWLHQFQFAGFYVAKEKGFYRDAGLDVTIEDAQNKRDPLKAVREGKAQYAVGHTSLVVDSMRGAPIVLMAAMFQSSPMMLLVREDSGIKTAKDLRGKRIMLTGDAAKGVEIQAMLRSAGLGPKDYTLQPHSYNPLSLEQNETDAMASYLSNEPFVLGKRGIKTRAVHPKEYGFDFYSDILFGSQHEYLKHPERMNAFYNASMRGWAWAFEHIEETAELIYRHYNPQNKSLESLIYEGEVLKQLAYHPNIAFGTIDPIRLEMMAQGYRLMGIAGDPFSSQPVIYKSTELHLNKAEKQWLKEHPVIHVGINPALPPVEFIDNNGKHFGIGASYLKLVEKRLGIRFEIDYSYHRWQDARKAVELKGLDMLSGAAVTDKSQETFRMSTPYFKQSMVIVADSDVGYVDDLDDLDGKKVAVVREYATQELIREKYPKLSLLLVDTPLEALQAVSSGKAYACVEGLNVVSYLIERNDIKHLKVVGEAPFQYELAFAFRKDWEMLAQITDKVLASVSPKEYQQIHGQWLVMKRNDSVEYTRLALVAGIIAIIIAFVVYKNRQLDRTVRQRTRELELFNQRLQEEIEKAVAKNRKQEKLLMQQAKMAEIGSMLESIAHQWRQPLNILGLSMTQLNLSCAFGGSGEAGKVIEIAEAQIEYMSQTIDDFRNFFKQDNSQIPVNISTAIGEVEGLLGPLLKRQQIRIIHKIDPDIEVLVYPNELKQVLINIFNNAREAIEHYNGGEREITVVCESNERYCTIRFEDTGGGVSPDIVDKIFDPYFTTKFESQGTGIGLYMAKMIIEKHFLGKLSVYNTSRGACFEIRLNRAEENKDEA